LRGELRPIAPLAPSDLRPVCLNIADALLNDSDSRDELVIYSVAIPICPFYIALAAIRYELQISLNIMVSDCDMNTQIRNTHDVTLLNYSKVIRFTKINVAYLSAIFTTLV